MSCGDDRHKAMARVLKALERGLVEMTRCPNAHCASCRGVLGDLVEEVSECCRTMSSADSSSPCTEAGG